MSSDKVVRYHSYIPLRLLSPILGDTAEDDSLWKLRCATLTSLVGWMDRRLLIPWVRFRSSRSLKFLIQLNMGASMFPGEMVSFFNLPIISPGSKGNVDSCSYKAGVGCSELYPGVSQVLAMSFRHELCIPECLSSFLLFSTTDVSFLFASLLQALCGRCSVSVFADPAGSELRLRQGGVSDPSRARVSRTILSELDSSLWENGQGKYW